MKNKFKWILGVSLIGLVGYLFSASNDFTDRWTIKNDSGTSVAYIDSSSNMTLTGNLTTGGNQTVTGNLAVTGTSAFTGNVTAATTTLRVLISTAPDTMITPGGAGQLVYNITDSQLCISTGNSLGSFILATTTDTVGVVHGCGH